MTDNDWEDVDQGSEWEDVSPPKPKTYGEKVKSGLKSYYSESVAPFVHAADLYAAGIPKAIGKIDKSPENQAAYEALYPEQKTFAGKATRVVASLPALALGSGGRLANAAGNLMTKAGSSFLRTMPKEIADRVAGNLAVKAVAGATKLAGEGAAFGAGYVPEDGKDYVNQIAGGATTNVVFPAAVKALQSIPKVSQWAAGRLINSWIKPTKGQYAYGKNPGLEYAKTVGRARSIDDAVTKTSKALKDTGAKIQQQIELNNVLKKGKTEIDISGVVKPFEDAMDEAAKQNNSALLNRLNEAKISILYNLERNEASIVKPQNMRLIQSLPAEQAIELKQQIGKMTKWTGNPSDDKLINSALQDAYRVVKNKLNEAVPSLKPLNETYGNLLSAKAALDNAVIRESKKEIIPTIAGKGIGLTMAGAGAYFHNPELIAVGLAEMGVATALKHPWVRTSIASTLAKMGNAEKLALFQKFPDLSKGVGAAAGKIKPIMTDEAYQKMMQNTSKKLQNKGGFASFSGTPYQGEQDLTTKTLEKLKGRTTVSKQFISDLTNQPDLKQVERDLIRKHLAEHGDFVDVNKFANQVKTDLLPLKGEYVGMRYENVTLPKDIRGNVKNYFERTYASPIKTSAGDIHYPYSKSELDKPELIPHSERYFAHSRLEDLPDKTRRVIEIQSDLFQKGNLEREIPFYKEGESASSMAANAKQQNLTGRAVDRINEIAKLEPYKNTWHERIIREEIKQAAKDGKSTLQFPTGETAMKIEGLAGGSDSWVIISGKHAGKTVSQDLSTYEGGLKVGDIVRNKSNGEDFIFMGDNYGDGFGAIPKSRLDDFMSGGLSKKEALKEIADDGGDIETFSYSNTKDNPIFKFYEKDVAKYLKRVAPDMKTITDKQGVTWNEISIPKEASRRPVEAYAIAGATAGALAASKAEAEIDDSKRQKLANVEVSGDINNKNYAQITPVVLKDLIQLKKIPDGTSMEDILKDRKLYEDVVSKYWDRMDDFGVPENVKHIWWYKPSLYKKVGGDVSKIKDDRDRNIIENRIKNENIKKR